MKSDTGKRDPGRTGLGWQTMARTEVRAGLAVENFLRFFAFLGNGIMHFLLLSVVTD
jgi:hypothetical protein